MKKYIMTIVLFHSIALYAMQSDDNATPLTEFVTVPDPEVNDPSGITLNDLQLLKNSEVLFEHYDNGRLLQSELIKHAALAALYGSITNIVKKDQSQWILAAFPLAWTAKELYVTVRQAKIVWNRKFLKRKILWQCVTKLSSECIKNLKTRQDFPSHLRIKPRFLDAIESFRNQSQNPANLNNF